MQVLQFFTGKRNQQPQTIQFTPSILINPNSTIFVQCSPNDPHTASNIIINSYPSKTNRVNLQTRIQWKRFKILTDSQHTNTLLPFNTGNAYRCQPADLGYYIQAKIISYDVACNGSAQVTIGPIRLDPTVKKLIQGALYSRSLRSQIKILQKNQSRDIDMLLSDKTIRFIDNITNKQLEMLYDMQQPKLQVNPKDPTKIFLRFQKDQTNKVRQWLDLLFQSESNFDVQSKKSMNSQGSGSSKSRVFKTSGSINKIQITFLTRHSRDQFIFSLRAFVCKQNIKNTIAIESIENVTQMRSPADAHKFFQYMSLKNQIYRLSELAKNLQIDRDNKLKDLISLQESIAETTTTYVQLLQKKGRQFNLDFNQSYSQISIRRDQIMGKKQLRQVQTQNEQLKQRIRELNEQLQLKQFFSKKNNQSVMLNQTSNPFAKKGIDSYYGPSMAYQEDQNIQKQNMNFAQLSKSHAQLIKQNQKLRQQKKIFIAAANNNQSLSKDLDMVNLLESLHQADEQPALVIQKLRAQIKQLKKKNQQMMEQMKKLNRTQIGKLNQSVAYQQQSRRQISHLHPNQQSYIDNSREGSFYSNLNDSMTSEAALMALQNKVKQIGIKNKQILLQNQRLRNERDIYRNECEKLKKNLSITYTPIDHRSVLSTSNVFDVQNLRQQNQILTNQRNSLRQKFQSLIKQNSKNGDGLFERKCEELTKENNYLRKQNEGLRQKVQVLRSQTKQQQDIFATENHHQNDRLKKINSQLLEQIKNLKLQMERKSNPLYNSRVIQLQNQINFLKNSGENGQSIENATKQLLNQISQLQKDVQNLTMQNSDKQAKLASQASLIERLMNSHQQYTNTCSGKDKTYSQTRNDSQSIQKLKKKIKQLQQEIVMMRRSADALNRSQDMSRDMLSYNQQQMQMYKKQKQIILVQNQRLSKMCQRYCKDARQANKQLAKWKQQVFDMMNNQKQQEI